MNSNLVHARFISLVLALTGYSVACCAGPNGTLYTVNYTEFGSGAGLDRIQGASLSSTPTGNDFDLALAVSGDVRTLGYYGVYSGNKFDLSGNPLVGGPYTLPNNGMEAFDGTSDGRYNYAVDYATGNVMQFDRDWLNPISLFSAAGQFEDLGLTMNVADGSFWVGDYLTGVVSHVSHSGSFISSFSTGFPLNGLAGLAFDASDGTLWAGNFANAHNLYQYDLSGTLLQTDSYAVDGAQFYGMEFNQTAVPEPASLAVLVASAIGLMGRKKR